MSFCTRIVLEYYPDFSQKLPNKTPFIDVNILKLWDEKRSKLNPPSESSEQPTRFHNQVKFLVGRKMTAHFHGEETNVPEIRSRLILIWSMPSPFPLEFSPFSVRRR